MSRVVPLPHLAIAVNGVPFNGAGADTLGSVRIRQRLSCPTQCELVFVDPPSGSDVATEFSPGRTLRVAASGQPLPLFLGEVTAVEHVYGAANEREVRVRAYDPLHRLRKRQPVCAHVQLTAKDLARELVADLGLSVEASEPGPLRQRLFQYDQSDLDLFVEVTEQCGLYFTLRENVLHLLTLAGIGEPVPLMLGESLLEANLEVNGGPACRFVTASGWNALRVETHKSTVSIAREGRTVAAQVSPASMGGNGKRSLMGEDIENARHAEALAQAELDRRVAGEVTFQGVTEGDARLQPGARVEVRGVDDTLAGRYVLTAATHIIDHRRGYVTEVSSVPPPPQGRSPGTVAALGLVTQVNDPRDLGRVRVKLSAYEDLETEWMQVLSAGAGNGKGLTIVPEVDDRVLVLLPLGNPSQGVVLGGLYGMQGSPDSGVESGSVRRYSLQTSGGLRIQLDDTKDTIRMENKQGSYVEFSAKQFRLHAAADLTVEAPGQTVVIRARKIDFQRG
ncbi:MAG: phage baseplate assembly protein V [Dehalococcoidia bacterium]